MPSEEIPGVMMRVGMMLAREHRLCGSTLLCKNPFHSVVVSANMVSDSCALRLLSRGTRDFTPCKDIVGGVIARVPRGTRDGNLRSLGIWDRKFEKQYQGPQRPIKAFPWLV